MSHDVEAPAGVPGAVVVVGGGVAVSRAGSHSWTRRACPMTGRP